MTSDLHRSARRSRRSSVQTFRQDNIIHSDESEGWKISDNNGIMPFRYRLQKVMEFRIRKKEEQILVVQKARQEVYKAEDDIRKNNEEIIATKQNIRQADPRMYEVYDKYLEHLWAKAEQLEEVRRQAQEQLEYEKQKLTQLEQAVKILEKHKEKQHEIYKEEEKAAELKQYSELGVTRYFRQSADKAEEDEEILRKLEQLEKYE